MSGMGVAGGAILSTSSTMELMLKHFNRLPESEQKFFTLGPMYFGFNAAFAGLLANSLFRRTLNVTHARVLGAMPMALFPAATTMTLYTAFVSNPLLAGELNCPSCAMIRGAAIGAVSGTLYPAFLGLLINAALAAQYQSAPMPDKSNMWRFAVDISRPVWRKMRAVVVIQACFGGFLSSRHYDTYTNLRKIVVQHESRIENLD